jgi:hypothetical protein
MIRRRRYEEEARSSERVRLSDHFSAVQAEVSASRMLLAADGDDDVSETYDRLIDVARSTAGRASHDAWLEAPIKTDAEMNQGPLFDSLAEFRHELSRFEKAIGHATLPRRRRWLVRMTGT